MKTDHIDFWGGLHFDIPGDFEGAWYYVFCTDGYTDLVYRPDAPPGADAVSPQELAWQATGLLPVEPPTVRTAPPLGSRTLVGLPTWFWVPDSEWDPRSKRVRAGDVWAEAVARPERLVIEPDGLEPVVCDGPGTPYAAGVDTDCAVTFARPGRYEVTISVTWGGRWHGSGGTGGALPPLTRSSTVSIEVAEAHSQYVAPR